ncbi:MAG TPA: glycoside hydrolase family 13 protein, partial [Cellulomonas sp.]
WLTAAGVSDDDVTDSTDFRLVAHEPSADWSAHAVVYEIFPDRFARSVPTAPTGADAPAWAVPCAWGDEVVDHGPLGPRQLFGGDLDGIVAHLDHLQALGVDTLYLRPVFPAASNHRYDAATFDEVDELVGGRPALDRLARAVHDRGMRLVGDLTTNHCGDTHEWFRAARRAPDAPERSMFYLDPDGGYASWYGVPTLPKLNWGAALVRERMTAVVQRWLPWYDGWRIDVANMTGRHGAEDRTTEVASLLRRAALAVRPDAALVAEHMFDASADLDADGWDGTMNYAGFTRPVWTWLRGPAGDQVDFIGVPGGIPLRGGVSAMTTMRAFAAGMSWRTLVRSWQVLDSFDCARIRTVVGSRERQVVAAGLQATLPGVPMICAGSELGLTAATGEQARTPMPWDRPAERDEVVHAAYRELFGLRSREPALREGGLRWLHADADTLVYARETGGEALVVTARRAPGPAVRLQARATWHGVHDASDLTPDEGHVELPGDGPSLRIWRVTER